MKVVRITESQLRKMVSDVVKEQKSEENYMFFSNLDQIERQCKMLREMDPKVIDNILSNGHDWADDHMTEAKSLMDQVFDFIMNEVKGHKVDSEPVSADMDSFSLNEEEEIDESKNKPTNPKLWAQCLAWARSKYDVCPSAYCNGAAAKRYKSKGGGWRKVK